MNAVRVCKRKYYGIRCDGPCCVAEAPQPVPRDRGWAVDRIRWDDLPTLGESVCLSARTCVLRAGHPGPHCSRTGAEWPVESLAGRGEGYG